VVNVWEIAEGKRIEALAATNAFWVIRERHRARVQSGDYSLRPEYETLRRKMTELELAYSESVNVAVLSGEKHPEET